MRRVVTCVMVVIVAGAAQADVPDLPSAFGARPNVREMTLSPDGNSVAYLTPSSARGTAVVTLSLAKDAKPKIALTADGQSEQIGGCKWVANDRLVCQISWIGPPPDLWPFTRLAAVNADGGNLKVLNSTRTLHSRGVELNASNIIDWLPEEDGVVLMRREILPTNRLGSRLGEGPSGLGVERIDTRTLAVQSVVAPSKNARLYITDGHGDVRIMAEALRDVGVWDSGLHYMYRDKGGGTWHDLSSYNYNDRTGFRPAAVDRDHNVAYGFRKTDGRIAFYKKSLDNSGNETLVFARDDVDVDRVLQIGRHQRVVGVTYVTDRRHAHYTDEQFAQLQTAFQKALPGRGVSITDASVDESKFLLFTGSDTDAGVYYLFDHNTHHLDTFMVVRSPLESMTLAAVRSVTYRTRDGVSVPAYLTLPPGKDNAKDLPAIVMPHGGPSARDEWGFNWLVQFFAARGYAVLQPNFRGSSGYGDQWFVHNGFQSWPTAIGDVLDAGRWLATEQGADPKRLAVVGWSYGGYAALQSVVADQTVFKAAVAIAPVTDLPALTEQYRQWSSYYLMRDFIGIGAQARDGSPARNAGKIKVPVLMFHGTIDNTVRINQSQLMDQALAAAGVKHQLVTYEGLDHQLEDSSARSDLLRRTDAFLQEAFSH